MLEKVVVHSCRGCVTVEGETVAWWQVHMALAGTFIRKGKRLLKEKVEL